MAPSVWIQYQGDSEYHSADPGNEQRPIDLYPGQAAHVSAEKAEQVTADFPADFVVSDERPASVAEPPSDPRAELLALKRPELNERAAAVGIADPDQLPNKEAVADAILAAEAAAASGEPNEPPPAG
jgi:hypothetical protein